MSSKSEDERGGRDVEVAETTGAGAPRKRLPFTRSGPDGGEKLQVDVIDSDGDSEAIAVAFLKKILRLRPAVIDRELFLRSQLKQRGVDSVAIDAAIATDVVTAGIEPAILSDIAKSSIDFEVRRSSAISFATGIGGLATLPAAVPTDLVQYYCHALRIMQKLAFVNGWRSFVDDADEVTDEVLGQFAVFLGVMMGVGGASNALRTFIAHTAAPAIGKNVANKALTKTLWYPFVKKVLQQVGVKITKDTAGKAVSRTIPVVGGVVSGGMTYASLGQQSRRLQRTLRDIPAPHVHKEN